ncbi:putative acetyltransferase [Atlantibacter hermannii]|nr:putative acetyltransferase [Atlantibacter hermannii]
MARQDGKIVGLVHYLFHRSTWAETDYCYLEDLFVSEDVRGKHIGKQLIEYVQQQARKRHAAHLYWHTMKRTCADSDCMTGSRRKAA